jgi:hypothetical protein
MPSWLLSNDFCIDGRVAGGCTLPAFVSACFISKGYRFVTLIVVGIAGAASVLAFLTEVVVYRLVNQKMQKLGAGAETNPGPGSSISYSSLYYLGLT